MWLNHISKIDNIDNIDDIIYRMISSNEIMYVYGGVTNQNIETIWLKNKTDTFSIYNDWEPPNFETILFDIVLLNHIPIEKYKIEISFLEYYLINKLIEVFGLNCLNSRISKMYETKPKYDINEIKYGETYSFYVFVKRYF